MKKEFTHESNPKKPIGFPLKLGGMCLLLFASFLVHAQHRAVSGTVKDKSDHHLVVAGLLVRSTSDGVATDKDGSHRTCLINNE